MCRWMRVPRVMGEHKLRRECHAPNSTDSRWPRSMQLLEANAADIILFESGEESPTCFILSIAYQIE